MIAIHAQTKQLDIEQLTCRIWEVSTFIDQPVTGYVHGPTFTKIGASVGYDFDLGLVRILMGQPARHGAGNVPDTARCVVRGVEAIVASDQIRTYLESEVKNVVKESVNQQLAKFIAEVQKANDAGRKKLLDDLLLELPKNVDLITALQNAMKNK